MRTFLGTTSACTKCITTAYASSAEYYQASRARAARTTNHSNKFTTMSHAYGSHWCKQESPLSNRLCIRKILVGISKLLPIATFRWHRNEHVSGIGIGIPSIEHQHRKHMGNQLFCHQRFILSSSVSSASVPLSPGTWYPNLAVRAFLLG